MSMRTSLFIALGVSALAGSAALAQTVVRDIERPDMPGRVVFEQQCAPCHGTGLGDDGSPTLPGTAALDAKYGGDRPGALELRSDLPAPVLRVIVRRGSGAMSGFRKGELTDEQIDQIAEYIAATAAANSGG